MRKNIFVLSLLALTTFGVTSCGTGERTECPTCPETPECPQVEPEKIVKKFELKLEVSNGAEVKELSGLKEGKCESGSKITFKVELKKHFALDKVQVNGETLTSDSNGLFSFRMPNENATLSVSTIDLTGGVDLLTVTKIADDFKAPTTLEEVKETLTKSTSVDGKFFKEATNKTEYEVLKSDSGKYSRKLFDYKIKASRNGLVSKVGINGNASDDYLKYYSETIGKKGDYLYSLTETSDNKKLSTSAETFKIVADGTEEVKECEVLSGVANNKTTGYLYGEKLIQTYLGTTTNFKKESTTVTSTIAANKETFTITLSSKGNFSSYSGQEFYELKVTFDGDNFLSDSTYSYFKFGKESFDTNKELIEGAIPEVSYSDIFKATRGYKEEVIEEPNIQRLAFNTYDVLTTCSVGGSSTYKIRNDGDVYIFGNTTFNFESKGDSKASILPRLVGVSKGDKEKVIIKENSVKFTSPGKYSLDFDNGLGIIKTIEFNALIPETKNIYGKFDTDKTFVGTSNILTITSSPEGSDSKAKVMAKETSAACDIVQNEDGTFTVTAKEAGKVDLDITLISNEVVTTTVSFEAVEKPTYEAVYANITTKSLYHRTRYSEKFYVNFNEDGTGVAYYLVYDELSATTTFKYTLNKDTLEFTFSDFTYDGLNKFVKVQVVTATEFKGFFEYGNKVSEYDMTLVDRKAF